MPQKTQNNKEINKEEEKQRSKQRRRKTKKYKKKKGHFGGKKDNFLCLVFETKEINVKYFPNIYGC